MKKSTTTAPPRRLIPMKPAVEELGVPYSSWRLVAKNENLELYKIGGRWYTTRADIDRFLEAHRERLS